MRHVVFPLALVAMASQASAEDVSAMDVLEMLRTADGSARVLMAGDVDMNLLEGVLVSLAEAPVHAVRFGVADNVPNRDAILKRLEDAGREEWGVCDLWLTKEGMTDSAAKELAEFGGSLIILDNGENDEERFHPAIGEDPNLGREENPMIFGFLDAVTDWGVLSDPMKYDVTWSWVYVFPLDMSEGGCR